MGLMVTTACSYLWGKLGYFHQTLLCFVTTCFLLHSIKNYLPKKTHVDSFLAFVFQSLALEDETKAEIKEREAVGKMQKILHSLI